MKVDLSPEGLADLQSIQAHNRDLATDIYTRIEEISVDQNIISQLTTLYYQEDGRLNIKIYQRAREEQCFVFRIRFFKTSPAENPGVEDFRIFYFLDPKVSTYKIIAIEEKHKRQGIDHPYDDPAFMAELKERYNANFTR